MENFSAAQNGRVWPQDGEPVELMYVGKLHEERNVMAICRAVVQANTEGMNFVLHLVGGGEQAEELKDFANKTSGQVQFVGSVPHDDVPNQLRKAHVGVTSLPGADNIKFGASSPIKLFEYMAAGLPILATDNVCHTEVVEQGQYAFWVNGDQVDDVVEALRHLWQTRRQLENLGAEAAASAHDWTWQAAGKKLSNALYHGLTSQV